MGEGISTRLLSLAAAMDPRALQRFQLEAQVAGSASVDLWGDGSPTREFLYAADAARGLVDAAQRYDDPDPGNLGAGFEIAMRDLAERVARATGYGGQIRWDANRPNGQPRDHAPRRRAPERFRAPHRWGHYEAWGCSRSGLRFRRR